MVNFCSEVSLLKLTKISFQFSFLNPVFALLVIRVFLTKQSMHNSALCPAVF